jgi:hypothetical protein
MECSPSSSARLVYPQRFALAQNGRQLTERYR